MVKNPTSTKSDIYLFLKHLKQNCLRNPTNSAVSRLHPKLSTAIGQPRRWKIALMCLLYLFVVDMYLRRAINSQEGGSGWKLMEVDGSGWKMDES